MTLVIMTKSLLFKVNVYFVALATGFILANITGNHPLRDWFFLLFALSVAFEAAALTMVWALATRRNHRKSRYRAGLLKVRRLPRVFTEAMRRLRRLLRLNPRPI